MSSGWPSLHTQHSGKRALLCRGPGAGCPVGRPALGAGLGSGRQRRVSQASRTCMLCPLSAAWAVAGPGRGQQTGHLTLGPPAWVVAGTGRVVWPAGPARLALCRAACAVAVPGGLSASWPGTLGTLPPGLCGGGARRFTSRRPHLHARHSAAQSGQWRDPVGRPANRTCMLGTLPPCLRR